MSQTETHFGKLRKVVFEEGQSLEQWCETKCKEIGQIEMDSYCNTWYEQLRNINDEELFFVNDEIWEAFEHIKAEEGDDIYHLQPNEDGTLTFVMQFYNGGTCLSECLEEAIKRLNKKS